MRLRENQVPFLIAVFIAYAQPEQPRGIVVFRVGEKCQAARAGFVPGDVIHKWTCGKESGHFRSPLELAVTEVEQSPRGPVILFGFRGSHPMEWTMGGESWDLETRPALEGTPSMRSEVHSKHFSPAH